MIHNQDNEVFELLKVWYFLKIKPFIWPAAVTALEDKINELLSEQKTEEWKQANLGPAQHLK